MKNHILPAHSIADLLNVRSVIFSESHANALYGDPIPPTPANEPSRRSPSVLPPITLGPFLC